MEVISAQIRSKMHIWYVHIKHTWSSTPFQVRGENRYCSLQTRVTFLILIFSGNGLFAAGYLLLTGITNYFGLDQLKVWFSWVNKYEDYHHSDEVFVV